VHSGFGLRHPRLAGLLDSPLEDLSHSVQVCRINLGVSVQQIEHERECSGALAAKEITFPCRRFPANVTEGFSGCCLHHHSSTFLTLHSFSK
jgi:hypothetical protein